MNTTTHTQEAPVDPCALGQPCGHIPGLILRLSNESVQRLTEDHELCRCCVCKERNRRGVVALLNSGPALPGSSV